jgi:hypothetical protein
LYGCKIWSLTFREDYMLRLFEDIVLRNIYIWVSEGHCNVGVKKTT